MSLKDTLSQIPTCTIYKGVLPQHAMIEGGYVTSLLGKLDTAVGSWAMIGKVLRSCSVWAWVFENFRKDN